MLHNVNRRERNHITKTRSLIRALSSYMHFTLLANGRKYNSLCQIFVFVDLHTPVKKQSTTNKYCILRNREVLWACEPPLLEWDHWSRPQCELGPLSLNLMVEITDR